MEDLHSIAVDVDACKQVHILVVFVIWSLRLQLVHFLPQGYSVRSQILVHRWRNNFHVSSIQMDKKLLGAAEPTYPLPVGLWEAC